MARYDPRKDKNFPRRDAPTPSIWDDDDVDADKLAKLTPKQRARMFPNDYDGRGMPKGDF
jgi:hypothetical protein